MGVLSDHWLWELRFCLTFMNSLPRMNTSRDVFIRVLLSSVLHLG